MPKKITLEDAIQRVRAEIPADAAVRWTITVDYVTPTGWFTEYVKGAKPTDMFDELAREVHNGRLSPRGTPPPEGY